MNPSKLLPIPEMPASILSPWLQPNTHPQTDFLKELSGDATLKLIQQDFYQTNSWERLLLNIADPQTFRREIIMYSHEKPCWYARTIIPESCFHHDTAFFEQLYTKTLTTLVYNQPKVRRQVFLSYGINEKCQEYHWVKKLNLPLTSPLWVRLSTFIFQEKAPFYLLEILLPDLMRLQSCA